MVRRFIVILILSFLISSCGGAAATEAPAPSQPPVQIEPPTESLIAGTNTPGETSLPAPTRTSVVPSTFDIEATVPFLDSLAQHPRVRRGELRVGLVGNKLKPWTNLSQQALDLLGQWPYPLVAQLRDSQGYAVTTALGKSLFDYHSAQVRDHQADWVPLVRWLKR